MVTNRGPSASPLRRGLLLASAVAVASTCSACTSLRPAWKHKAAQKEAGAPLASSQTQEEAAPPEATPAPQTASAPVAYPWANGATMPTAIANAPSPAIKR